MAIIVRRLKGHVMGVEGMAMTVIHVEAIIGPWLKG